MKPVKKTMLVIVSVCLLAVGVTYALVSQITETATNTFTSNRDIKLELREEKWDGYGFEDQYPGIPGTVAEDPNDNQLGINIANNYYPGDMIPKNPILKNVSSNEEPEWVAMKVEYLDSSNNSIPKEQFKKFAKIHWFNGNEFVDGINPNFETISTGYNYDLFFYTKELKSNQVTPALFDQIVINSNLQPDSGEWPNFKIRLTGYAVQSKNVEKSIAKEELKQLSERK